MRRSVFVGESRILRYDNTMGRRRTYDEEEIDDDEEKGERKMKKNEKKDCRCRDEWGRGDKKRMKTFRLHGEKLEQL